MTSARDEAKSAARVATEKSPAPPRRVQLLTPGPTAVPDAVAEAGSWPMISHRGEAFSRILARVLRRLPEFFQTRHEVLCFPAAGTGAMEACVTNLLSPDDRVAAISIGFLGDRFADVAEAFGARVERVAFPWGTAADPGLVAERLAGAGELGAVHLTHVETSTGVKNDLPRLIDAIRAVRPEALIVVDAFSSLGCIDVPMDRLGIDVMYAGSHKGWLCPPGLATVAVGPRARAAEARARLPRYYWDFDRTRRAFALNVPPYGASVTLWYQLDVALSLMRREGRDAIHRRHADVARYTRERIRSMGLALFGDPARTAETLTVIERPAGLDLSRLEEEEGVVFSAGQDRLTDRVVRIGHLGAVEIDAMRRGLDALERQLAKRPA